MNKTFRASVLIVVAVSFGAWLTAQSPSFPGIQGFDPSLKKWIGVQVDKDGKLIVSGGGGGGCADPCPVLGSVAVGAAASDPVTTGARDDSGNVIANYNLKDVTPLTISAGTDTVVVAGVSSTFTWMGHISFTLDSAQTVTIRQGTGTTCGTNTAILWGPAPNVTAVALDGDSSSPAIRTTVAARDICIHLGGSATVGGGAVYGTHP